MYGGMYEEEVEEGVLSLVITGEVEFLCVEEVEGEVLIFESGHYRC